MKKGVGRDGQCGTGAESVPGGQNTTMGGRRGPSWTWLGTVGSPDVPREQEVHTQLLTW